MKKRRYRELDSCWSIDDSTKGNAEVLRATHLSDVSSAQNKSGNKREIKLEKKLLQKLAKEPKPSSSLPYRQKETVTGNFSTLIIELTRDRIPSLGQRDQEVVYDAEMTEVDNIRLIKTNQQFYKKCVGLWFKFKALTRKNTPVKEISQQVVDLQNYICQQMLLPSSSQNVRAVHLVASFLVSEDRKDIPMQQKLANFQ